MKCLDKPPAQIHENKNSLNEKKIAFKIFSILNTVL